MSKVPSEQCFGFELKLDLEKLWSPSWTFRSTMLSNVMKIVNNGPQLCLSSLELSIHLVTPAGLCCEAAAPRQGASLCSGFLFEAEEILAQVDVGHWAR